MNQEVNEIEVNEVEVQIAPRYPRMSREQGNKVDALMTGYMSNHMREYLRTYDPTVVTKGKSKKI